MDLLYLLSGLSQPGDCGLSGHLIQANVSGTLITSTSPWKSFAVILSPEAHCLSPRESNLGGGEIDGKVAHWGTDTVNCNNDDEEEKGDFSLLNVYLALDTVEVPERHDLIESFQLPAS